MGYLCLGLMTVLWIGVGVALLVRNRQRKAEGRFDPQTGSGVKRPSWVRLSAGPI